MQRYEIKSKYEGYKPDFLPSTKHRFATCRWSHQKNKVLRLCVMMSTSIFCPMTFIMRR